MKKPLSQADMVEAKAGKIVRLRDDFAATGSVEIAEDIWRCYRELRFHLNAFITEAYKARNNGADPQRGMID